MFDCFTHDRSGPPITHSFFSVSFSLSVSSGMKRPFSPAEEETLTEHTGHRGVSSDGVEFTTQDAPPASHRPKRERKHRSYTLCEVCNIQLNSAAQAQIHYNGKTHQKRLKHINNSNTGMIMCRSLVLLSNFAQRLCS